MATTWLHVQGSGIFRQLSFLLVPHLHVATRDWWYASWPIVRSNAMNSACRRRETATGYASATIAFGRESEVEGKRKQKNHFQLLPPPPLHAIGGA